MVEDGQHVEAGDQLYKGSLNPHELLKYRGVLETARYIVGEVQDVYHKQGVQIDDKHVELIFRQMTKKVLVETPGDTSFLPGRMVDKLIFEQENERVVEAGGEPATYEEIILGITKASLATESFLSAASFQETTKVLTDAALEGKVDELRGLKENVIIGKLIPAATGLRAYRNIELVTAGIPAEMDLFGDVIGPRLDAGIALTPEQQWAQLTGSSPELETYNMLVDDLDLPTYVHSVLSRAGIERVSDLLAHTTKELLAVPGLGQKSLEEVRSRLAERGWALSGDEDDAGDDVLLGGGEGDEPEAALLGSRLPGGRSVDYRGMIGRGVPGRCRPPEALLYFAVAVRVQTRDMRVPVQRPMNISDEQTRSICADDQPVDPQGPRGTVQEDEDPCPQRRTPEAGRLHACVYHHAQEAQLGPEESGARAAGQRDGSDRLHPRYRAQPAGALRGPHPGWPGQRPTGRPLQDHPRGS